MDFVTTYLNSEIDEEVYIEQPYGFIKDPTKVYRIRKGLYGLK